MKPMHEWKTRLAGWVDVGPAILRLPEAPGARAVNSELDGAGIDGLVVDLSAAEDKADMMQAFQRDLRWPEWFGANWDALADMLMDTDGSETRRPVLILSGWNLFAASSPENAASLLNLIEELSAEPECLLLGALLLHSPAGTQTKA